MPLSQLELSQILTQVTDLGSQLLQIIQDQTYDDDTKTALLKSLEESGYKPLLKRLAYPQSKTELQYLNSLFEDLGDLSTSLAGLTGDLKYYTDAAIFHQYVIGISHDKLDKTHQDTDILHSVEAQYNKLDGIKRGLLSAIHGVQATGIESVAAELSPHKAYLQQLREHSATCVAAIEQYRSEGRDELYVNCARELFDHISTAMRSLLVRLYEESERVIGTSPPCKYSVIGLGSIALKQATPYSDFEFAILAENEDYKAHTDPRVSQYFKHLTHLVHFTVINLGETKIHTAKYGFDLSHLIHRGVAFDSGGHTPLGHMEQSKPFDLVRTVGEMFEYVRNSGDRTSHIDKLLPYILSKACHIYGDEALSLEYQIKTRDFLQSEVTQGSPYGSLYCEVRALDILRGKVLETYSDPRILVIGPRTAREEGNLEEFEPLPLESAGRLFNVKKEIYRLPDRFLHNLGAYYMQDGDSVFDTIDNLLSSGIINEVAAKHLRFAATFANMLRLKTYLHNKGQREDMSILDEECSAEGVTRQRSSIFYLYSDDLSEDSGLFAHFYTALGLYNKVAAFSDAQVYLSRDRRAEFFSTNEFYSDDSGMKGLIHYRLGQYSQARSNLEDAIAHPTGSDGFSDVTREHKSVLGKIYISLGLGRDAIEQFQGCLGSMIFLGASDAEVARIYGYLGEAYHSICEYEEARECHTQCLAKMQSIYRDQPHAEVANTLNNIGLAFHAMEQYESAQCFYHSSLEMRRILYHEEPHPDIACTLCNFGRLHVSIGECGNAIRYYKQCLEMLQIIHRGEAHQELVVILNNLGSTYSDIRSYDDAIGYYAQSLVMLQTIHGSKPHPDIAYAHNKLGEVYCAVELYTAAIKHYTMSFSILKNPELFQHTTILSLSGAQSTFTREQYIESTTKYITNAAKKFASQHSLNSWHVVDKVLSCAEKDIRFADYSLHYTAAVSIIPDNISAIRDAIEEYKLALIFLPQEERGTRALIESTLSRLVAVEYNIQHTPTELDQALILSLFLSQTASQEQGVDVMGADHDVTV